jgi:hypothetical protein
MNRIQVVKSPDPPGSDPMGEPENPRHLGPSLWRSYAREMCRKLVTESEWRNPFRVLIFQ